MTDLFPTPDDTDITGLRSRLADAAAGDGLLDVAYRTLDTPIGTLLIAATPRGVVRIALPNVTEDEVLEDLASRVSPRILRSSAPLDAVTRQLDNYFTGALDAFDVTLDFSLSHGFRREVLLELRHVPYGETRSYGELAVATGSPRAVRAVGTACATNPLPIVVPCHRITRSDGTLGNYGGGVAMKQALLVLEGAIHDE